MVEPMKMSEDECRDWLAKRYGWSDDCDSAHYNWFKTLRTGDVDRREEHPIPATLDGAAACLPEGWTWQRNGTRRGLRWWAFTDDWSHEISLWDTGNERLDRFRLAVAALSTRAAGGEGATP